MKLGDGSELHTAQSRSEMASAYIRKIGYIMPFYVSPIRAIAASRSILKTDDPRTLQNFAVGSTLTSIKVSPSLTEGFRLAANELYEDYIHELGQKSVSSLYQVLNLLQPTEISGVLSITYLFKLLKKVCEEDEFDQLAPTLSLQLQHAGEQGIDIHPDFGRGGGIAAAGIRVLSFAVLMKANPKGYKKLRRMISSDGQLMHLDFELENWGCTQLDIASNLAGTLGFGHAARSAFLALQTGDDEVLVEEARWWLECLRSGEDLWKAQKTDGKKMFLELEGTDLLEGLPGYRWLWSTAESLEQDPIAAEGQEMPVVVDPPEMVEIAVNYQNSPVLIVEDEPVAMQMMAKQLKNFSNKTLAANAEEAIEQIRLQKAKGDPFQIAFLDVSLPGLSGIELLRQIRAEERVNVEAGGAATHCKILMVTASEEPMTVVEAFNEGADAYVTKPAQVERLNEEFEKMGIIATDTDPTPT